MRYFFLGPLLLGLALPVLAQDEKPGEEPILPSKLEKVTLTPNVDGHTAFVSRVFFTPDTKQLVSVSADHTVRIWDVPTGAPVRVLYPPGFGGIAAAALSPNGKTLAVGSCYPEGGQTVHVIYLLALADGRVERVLKGHPGPIEALAFSPDPDGKRLASTSAASAPGKKDGTVRIWETATGRLEKAYPFIGDKSAFFREIRRALAFSPDGQHLARVRPSGGPGDILDLASGKPAAPLRAKGAVAWSPRGDLLATLRNVTGGGGIQLCKPDGTELRLLLPGQPCHSIAFNSDGTSLLATWGHSDFPETGILDVATAELVVKGQAKNATHGALSADGQLAVTTANHVSGLHGLTLWNAADGKVIKRIALKPMIFTVDNDRPGWSKDGKIITWNRLGNKKSFHLETLELGPPLAKENTHRPVLKEGPLAIQGTKLYRDGNALGTLFGYGQTLVGARHAASHYRGIIHLYDASTGKEIRQLQAHQGELNALVPSPDGRLLLSTSVDQMVKIWNLEQDRPLLSLFAPSSDWVVWAPQGYYAASPNGDRLVGWKVDNGIDQAPSFYPAEQFQKVLYRPDIIKLVAAKGSVDEALKAANAARSASKQEIPRGLANPEKLLPAGVTLQLLDKAEARVTLKISARQSCPEQPIKSLRLLVDGRPLSQRVAFKDGDERAEYDEPWQIELPPGKHKLSVLARSKDDAPSFSNVIELEAPLPEKDRPVVRHLAVGISAYDNPKLKLHAAATDAAQLAEAVERHCAGKENLYREAQATTLLNEKATRVALLEAIDTVRQQAKPNDLFLLSFAGHGVREEGEYFLLTKEADTTSVATLQRTAVSGSALREKLADFPCQVLLLLDACHAGLFGAGALAAYRPATDAAARALADVDVRVAVMCAALGHEEALEGETNGYFTAAVLRALQCDKDCFYDRHTGELNVYHLQAFVYQEVARASAGKQTPFLKMPLALPPFILTRFRVAEPALGRDRESLSHSPAAGTNRKQR